MSAAFYDDSKEGEGSNPLPLSGGIPLKDFSFDQLIDQQKVNDDYIIH